MSYYCWGVLAAHHTAWANPKTLYSFLAPHRFRTDVIGAEGVSARACCWDVLLLGVFVAQHTAMAAFNTKDAWAGVAPPVTYRPVYVLVTLATLTVRFAVHISPAWFFSRSYLALTSVLWTRERQRC